MKDSDYYPAGAYNDPNAPYNQYDNEPIDVDVTVTITLSKDTVVSTDNYIAEEWEDWDNDDEGGYIHTGGVDFDYSNVDFLEEYEKCEFTIPQLLDELVKLAQDKINAIKDSQEFSASGKTRNGKKIQEIRRLQAIINDASGWEEQETEVERND
jgi:hypothetical protein